MTWNEQAWQRHLVLSSQDDKHGSSSGHDWYYYHIPNKPMVFLNHRTGGEKEIPLTEEQINTVFYGNKVLQDLSFSAELFN